MQLADNVTQNISIVFVKENICESFFLKKPNISIVTPYKRKSHSKCLMIYFCISKRTTDVANTQKYLQSDWLRGVQYWPYLYFVLIFVLFDLTK